MGLDGVCIVMNCEKTFSIDIPDADAVGLAAPQLLMDYVAARVRAHPQESCITQNLYHRLRNGFVQVIPALVREFGLDQPLDAMIHKDQWPRVWAAIRAKVGSEDWPVTIPWPGLLRAGPRTVRDLVWYVALGIVERWDPNVRPWTREGVALKVRAIVTEETGLPLSFNAKARFRDLGVD